MVGWKISQNPLFQTQTPLRPLHRCGQLPKNGKREHYEIRKSKLHGFIGAAI
jgi:hypothetical protein